MLHQSDLVIRWSQNLIFILLLRNLWFHYTLKLMEQQAPRKMSYIIVYASNKISLLSSHQMKCEVQRDTDIFHIQQSNMKETDFTCAWNIEIQKCSTSI